MADTTYSQQGGSPEPMDHLLNLLCGLLLLALPILMVYGHLRAIGVVWNHATGQTFSPLVNHISDYAYRSPAWWAVVACIHGFSLFFAWLSWRATGKPRSIVSWVVMAAAAIIMFQLHQVAVHPVRSPELTIRRLQSELDKGPIDKAKDRIWRIALETTGHHVPADVPVATYVANHQRDRLHLAGIRPTRYLILVTMGGSLLLWMPVPGSRGHWWIAHAAVLAGIILAAAVAWWKPGWPGLSQRILYAVVYGWMWILLQQIRRNDRVDLRARQSTPNNRPVADLSDASPAG
ncbi:MAG: hypothetical protein H7A49_09990 [Akkermansiaceae bacterium]|nr:hypothetical protein [Akkermansiaceae bacterium]MCP5544223.1 hypothetical protein [Akkermansiaceae bacterium]